MILNWRSNLKNTIIIATNWLKRQWEKKTGKSITYDSSVKEIWKSIVDILNPLTLAKTKIKIQKDDNLIEDPLELAETFNTFFKEKIELLASNIKTTENMDPLSKLSKKL